MNRRNRHIVIVAVAVVTATLASAGIYRAVTRIPVREVEVAKTYVVVAARPLPPGVRLTAQDIRLAAWPSGSPIAGSFSTTEAVVNRALLAAVVENEPLLQTKVAAAAAGAGLSPAIPAGMRAMAVRVDEVIGVAGYLDTGTRVDLVVTIRNREESTSRTVVSNVQVLSAGTRYEQERARTGNEAPSAAAVVTLLVSPQDAERIALAQAEGQIMLVLRNPLDTQPTSTGGVRMAGLFGEPAPAPEPPRPVRRAAPPKPQPAAVEAPAAPAPPPAYTVEAIRAAKRTEEEVAR
jgi:pilus assembly protein CpaB